MRKSLIVSIALMLSIFGISCSDEAIIVKPEIVINKISEPYPLKDNEDNMVYSCIIYAELLVVQTGFYCDVVFDLGNGEKKEFKNVAEGKTFIVMGTYMPSNTYRIVATATDSRGENSKAVSQIITPD